MDIYSPGLIYGWEIWVGIILAVVILYFGIRATRKDTHRRQRNAAMSASARPGAKAPPRSTDERETH